MPKGIYKRTKPRTQKQIESAREVCRESGKRPRRFLESLIKFLADPSGLTQKEIAEELKQQGIDVNRLKDRLKQIIKKREE